jgi:hypothetical protein
MPTAPHRYDDTARAAHAAFRAHATSPASPAAPPPRSRERAPQPIPESETALSQADGAA